jgi:hypothetical protein
LGVVASLPIDVFVRSGQTSFTPVTIPGTLSISISRPAKLKHGESPRWTPRSVLEAAGMWRIKSGASNRGLWTVGRFSNASDVPRIVTSSAFSNSLRVELSLLWYRSGSSDPASILPLKDFSCARFSKSLIERSAPTLSRMHNATPSYDHSCGCSLRVTTADWLRVAIEEKVLATPASSVFA